MHQFTCGCSHARKIKVVQPKSTRLTEIYGGIEDLVVMVAGGDGADSQKGRGLGRCLYLYFLLTYIH